MPAELSLVLLPGMDGTGRLFEPFIAELPATLRPVIVSYPPDRPLGYADLESLVDASFPAVGRFVILSESFSGPLALRIAARGHPRLIAIVLAASFVRSPVGPCLSGLRWLVGPWCFQVVPPAWVVRRLLAGDDAAADLVATIRSAVGTVSPSAMAKRLRQVLAIDARDALPRIRVPVLSISGSRDRLVPARNVDDLQPLGNLLETVTFDAPHMVLQRQPAAAARLIDDFLKRRLTAE